MKTIDNEKMEIQVQYLEKLDQILKNQSMMTEDFPPYISSSTIAKSIRFEDVEHMPRIILSVATVRSGTTATLRLFAESGLKSYRQPFKAIMREQSESGHHGDRPFEWLIPAENDIYVKETLGPHTIYESLLNPIDVLIQVIKNALKSANNSQNSDVEISKLIQSKLHIIIMGRNPIDAWQSNHEAYQKLIRYGENNSIGRAKLSSSELLKNFIIAYQQVNNLKHYANHLNIPVSHYLYEANKSSQEAFTRLFQRIGIQQAPVIHGWTQKSIIGGKHSNVFVLTDYNNQKNAGLHDRVNSADGLQFFPSQLPRPSDEIIHIIQRSGLFEIYDGWKLNAEKEMGISIA